MCYSNNSYLFSDGKYFMQSDGNDIKKIFDIKKDKTIKVKRKKNKDQKWSLFFCNKKTEK